MATKNEQIGKTESRRVGVLPIGCGLSGCLTARGKLNGDESWSTQSSLLKPISERVALVINVSGGKDSTRTLGYLRSRFLHIPTYCLMADTGFEHVRPVQAVEWSHQIATRFGIELHVVRNPNTIYLEMVRARGKFPSAQFRQCTSDLKRGPIQKFIRRLPHQVLINRMGMRAQESA